MEHAELAEKELPQASGTVRVKVCLVFDGLEAKAPWPEGVEELVRKLYKRGVSMCIVGPKSIQKPGTKGHLKFFDRHDVATLKFLKRTKEQPLEIRLLGRKLKAWTRVRADICIVSGSLGVWPDAFSGWSTNGVLTLDSLSRWINEFHFVPGRKFLFLGSSNRVLSWANHLLGMGAQNCMIVEQGKDLKCWRAHRDRFLANGGRIYLNHEVLKLSEGTGGASHNIFLKNEEGTLVLDVDTVVMSSLNQESLNSPDQWEQGLIYVQRQYQHDDPIVDEGPILSRLDWSEVYWLVCRKLDLADKSEINGAIDRIRDEKKKFWSYRKISNDFSYSGKNLDKESILKLHRSRSSPVVLSQSKALASLECAQNVPCTQCVSSCPEDAITKNLVTDLPVMDPDKCTGCGVCVSVCPASAAVMLKETAGGQMTRYFLPDDTKEMWKEGDSIELLNRKGESVASGRVISSQAFQGGAHRVLEVESAAYNLWDARQFKKVPTLKDSNDPLHTSQLSGNTFKNWITLNGVKRLSPVNIPITVALWKLGYRRFEDGFFCQDHSCRMCVVTKNGREVLACKEIIEEDDVIEYGQQEFRSAKECVCSQASKSEVSAALSEGVSKEVICEMTGFAQGRCKGRWCATRVVQQRPSFPGFQGGLWREILPSDLLPDKNN